MSRSPRTDQPGAVHHAYVHLLDDLRTAMDDTDRTVLRAILRKMLRRTHTHCLAWAAMDNHFHLVLETGDTHISRVMQRISSAFARAFNARRGRRGRVQRESFGSRRVESDDYLFKLIAYVLANPIGAPGARDVAELSTYRWSGYAELMGVGSDPVTDVQGVLALYGKSTARARACLRAALVDESQRPADERERRFIELTTRAKIDEPLHGVAAIVGRRAFLDRVSREWTSRSARRAALRGRGWTLQDLVRHVCNLLDADRAALRCGRRSRGEVRARAVIAYLACDLIGELATEVARATGVSPTAIGAARGRGPAVLEQESLDAEFVIGTSCGATTADEPDAADDEAPSARSA